MVRVISEKLFSPPRSRHSSGETLDKELAARAVEALSSLESRRLDFFSDYESSSDSHWDSEADQDCDSQEGSLRAGQGEGCSKTGAAGEDIVRKRKERRRERNKLSAQAYRMRRREQSVKQQKVLSTLEEENTRLKLMVENLESELGSVRAAMRHRHASQPDAPPFSGPQQPLAPPSTFPSASTARPVGGICPGTLTCQRDDDDDEAGDDDDEGSSLGVRREAVDNDRMQLGNVPMVDNFLFNTKPALAHSAAAMPSVPSTSLCFGVSTSGARPRIATTTTSTYTTTTTIKDAATNIFSLAGANSNDTSTGVPLHHIPHFRQHANPFSNSDLNANTAGNTTCNVRGTNQHLHNNNNSIIVLNDDMNNNDNTSQFQQHCHNNSNMLLASSLGSGRKTKPACHSGQAL